MDGWVRPARRLDGILGALSVALPAGLIWLALKPPVSDMAAQAARVWMFKNGHGWQIWEGQWYGGHHLPGYSLLSPALGAALGVWTAGFFSACAAAAGMGAIGSRAASSRPQARVIGALIGVGTIASLVSGRLTWLLGMAIAALAVELMLSGSWLAVIAALFVSPASPVAAVFLAVAGGAAWLIRRERLAIATVVAGLIPGIVISIAFPTGGMQPFPWYEFFPIAIATAALLWLTPTFARNLWAGTGMYLLLLCGAFAIHSPVGSNSERLGQLAGLAAVAAAAYAGADRKKLIPLFIGLLVLQWIPPVQDIVKEWNDPATEESFHQPLINKIKSAGGQPGRLEVLWTTNHWEDAIIAPKIPLARGWERQLDTKLNAVVDGPVIDPVDYRRWIDSLAVRWVAVPNVALDRAAKGEAALVAQGLPWLKPVWQSKDWKLFEVENPTPIVTSGATGPSGAELPTAEDLRRRTALGTRSLSFDVPGPGPLTVRVRWSHWWKLEGVKGCLERDPSGMTLLRAEGKGRATLLISGLDGGPHCN